MIKDIHHILKQEADSVTDKAIRIPFVFEHIEALPKGKLIGDSIVIRPMTVRTYFKLKPLLALIETEDLNKLIEQENTLNTDVIKLVEKYSTILFDIVCLGIHNKSTDPPQWFREVLSDNTTWDDIYILFNAIVHRIGNASFCKSITLMRKVSPISEVEIIALQKNKETWEAHSPS
ncbi:MAG: hypothetical protein ACRDDZ_01265 [Marinifilaceae bacterium]